MLGKYNVAIEYLDENGEVYDSHDLLYTDDYDEAFAFAETVIPEQNEQVAIWVWDDNEQAIEETVIISKKQ